MILKKNIYIIEAHEKDGEYEENSTLQRKL